MSVTYVESELEFTFPDDLQWKKLDSQGAVLPIGMKLVDLVIERSNDILLIEIKDPSDSQIPEAQRAAYYKRLRDNSVLKEELTPKARDSYTHEHLMQCDKKPFVYIVIIGMDSFSAELQSALITNFGDRLYGSVRHESQLPWVRQHIKECVVLTVDMWNTQFPQWRITRKPIAQASPYAT